MSNTDWNGVIDSFNDLYLSLNLTETSPCIELSHDDESTVHVPPQDIRKVKEETGHSSTYGVPSDNSVAPQTADHSPVAVFPAQVLPDEECGDFFIEEVWMSIFFFHLSFVYLSYVLFHLIAHM